MRAEDDEMSNALMNDMADALRSAGLGSMVHSNEVEPEPEAEPETPSETVAEEDQKMPIETLLHYTHKDLCYLFLRVDV